MRARVTPPLVPRAHAVLHAGGMSIDYVRVGLGETVVLLQAGGSCSASAQPLIEQLAHGHRVIVPVLASDDSFAVALDNLLEGLGAGHVELLAVGEFWRLAREYVASRPGRVSSLVTL